MPGDITALLEQLGRGNPEAEARLVPLIYGELRRMAARYMRRERPDHTLEATALVHEAYVRLVGQTRMNWRNRAHFFGVTAQIMRRILVDHARKRQADKRGGVAAQVSLDHVAVISPQPSEELLALDEALLRLSQWDPRQCRIVELKYFAGLEIEEIAAVLEVSPRTVKRDWNVARAWLRSEIRKPLAHDTRAMGAD